MTPPTCGVVVCAYTEDRWSDISAGLAALSRQTMLPAVVVLVVDHNADLLSRAKAVFGDRIGDVPLVVVANEEKQGLSGGRNTGVRRSNTDVVAFLDDDAEPELDWVEQMVGPYSDPSVMAVGGLVLPVWPEGGRPKWLAPEWDWTIGCSYTGLPAVAGPVRNPIGANMSFRREVFEIAGWFDTSVGRIGKRPLGCEETELCIRLRQSKPEAVVFYDPSVVVHHRVTPARVKASYFRSRCFSEGLSKAVVAELVGADDALSSERAYTGRVLTSAIRRDVAALGGGDRDAASKVATTTAGLALAAAGYARGRVTLTTAKRKRERQLRRATAAEAEFGGDVSPIRVLDIDLEGPGPKLGRTSKVLRSEHQFADVLVHRNAIPVARVQLPVVDGLPDMDQLRAAAAVNEQLVLSRPVGDSRITIVVPTFNRPGQLTRLVESLDRLLTPADVIIVDNSPHLPGADRVVAELAETRPWLHYLAEPKAGASNARNRGLAAVETPYVAFTDDDVSVNPAWIDGLLHGFSQGEHVACVTGLVLPAELETAAQIWFEEYGGFGKGMAPKNWDLDSEAGPLYPFAAGTFGSGNNVAFRTEALRELGGYDSRLGPGTRTKAGEDLDLFIRIVLAGGTLAYEPAAVIRHWHRTGVVELRQQLADYGVGLSAALTGLAISNRRAALSLAKRAPVGVSFMLSSKSPKNVGRSRSYPAVLARAELSGLLVGPVARTAAELRRTS